MLREESVSVTYKAVDTVHYEVIQGDSISMQMWEGGRTQIVVFDAEGNRIRTLLYQNVIRVDKTYASTSGESREPNPFGYRRHHAGAGQADPGRNVAQEGASVELPAVDGLVSGPA